MKLMHLISAAAIITTAACTTKTTDPDQKYSDYPVYAGNDLELTVTPDSTIFTLWSPDAQDAHVNLYHTDLGGEPYSTLQMTPAADGTWRTATPGALYGVFYTFQILHNDTWLDETPGIYAKAVGTNGRRAAIIDLATTNPDGWDQDRGPELASTTDAIIYEMHHRDFSAHPTAGSANPGKFLALTEHGTKSPQGLATGIDHLKQLGITHVHILPSFDYNSVDETALDTPQYNWGYDPTNYNAPEGSYSTDPADPAARIREFKQMVKALHDAGIGVIMDVVYNHTALGDDSNFSLTAPGYFYRHRPDGSYSDASGCGNETASERPMMRQYMINSLRHWAEEYHIDGFRFDLMAIHDTETMNQISDTLHAINPSIILYGEGWTAGDSPLPTDQRALKENVAKMHGIAVFSDDIRDAIKGHYSDAADPGFATAKPGNEETVKIGIVAATAHPQVDYSLGNNSRFPYADAPTQIINYVSCHDDLMLTDKLRISMPDASDSDRQRAARLAQTIVMTSQGTPFIFAGEEIFRDKKGTHNSYKSPDSINAIDWTLKDTNADQYRYYRNLIRLRNEHPAFRLTTADQIARHLVFDTIPDQTNLISYSLIDNAGGDPWREIKVIFNGNTTPAELTIPNDTWTIVAADGQIDPDGIHLQYDPLTGILTSTHINKPATLVGGTITVAPTSALILHR